MAASPENKNGSELGRDIIRSAKKNPYMAAMVTVSYILVGTGPLWLSPLSNFLNSQLDTIGNTVGDTQFFRDLNERTEKQKQEVQALLQARQDVLKADFEQTDGVDKIKIAERSWLLTITRPSSTLGGTPPEILARVTKRIVDETGCQGVLVSEAYVDRSSWFKPKPTVYSAAAIDCPK